LSGPWVEYHVLRYAAAYQRSPTKMLFLTITLLLLGPMAFAWLILPKRVVERPIVPTRPSQSEGDMSTASRAMAREIRIKGVIRRLGDTWVQVDTDSAAYQVRFPEGLPNGCHLKRQCEVRGRYVGYDYTSSVIHVMCESFKPLGPVPGQ